jgi:zinc transport system ATP-binding protein
MDSGNDYILRVENLSVNIQNRPILDNINFELKEGTTLAIVGPNGAGKSMLFRALLNLVPYNGKVVWADDVKIGYVPQNLSAGDIPISVREFLSFKGCKGAESCLSSVGLDHRDMLDKRLGTLSGGQLQRVLIAWAIIDGPNVLLFDEPTSAVDIDSEEAIYEMLNRLEKEKVITVLIISHDIHVIRDYSEYMLAINRKMIFFGESERIVNPDLLKAIYGSETVLRKRKDGR